MLKLKVHEDSKPTVIWKTALGKEIVTTIYISTSTMAFVAFTKAARFNQMWDPSNEFGIYCLSEDSPPLSISYLGAIFLRSRFQNNVK